MGKFIRLKKGFNIRLKGGAVPNVVLADQVDTFAVKPTDFHNIYLAKPLVQEGDNVKAGSPLFFDKRDDRIVHVSPVSGEVVKIERGEKRKLLEIRILVDRKIEHITYKKHLVSDIPTIHKEEAKKIMLEAGVWPNIIQRPFGIIADPDSSPKAIHISTFDSHPLAPEYGTLFKNQRQFFQAGVDILKRFTSGLVHLNIHANKEIASFFTQIKGVEVNKFSGMHPIGCVGVQIHHINPINKGDVVWTIHPFGVIQIGKLFLQGIHDASRIVALAGSEVKNPQYYQTYTGASIKKIIEHNLIQDNVRCISGNVFTGTRIEKDGYIGYFDHCVTVLPEVGKHNFFGWIAPMAATPSFHRAFGLVSFLMRRKGFTVNTNMYGDPRAFVQTGAFEQVTPMDILPTYLLKAILAKDIDEMEELGIYEVIEEDLALCEFIDVSKHRVQRILREGIELLQSE